VSLPRWIKKANWVAEPIIESNLNDLECRVFDLALAGICGGDVDAIWQMDVDVFDKLYSYYVARQQIKNAWQHIANHQQLEGVKNKK
jgi:hypothetical protein